MPLFPLGGFTPLSDVSTRIETRMQVAQAWLLQRALNILLIPGTSSAARLHENLAFADIDLPAGTIAELDDIVKATS